MPAEAGKLMLTIYDLLIAVHRKSAASLFGVFEVSEHELSDHEKALVDEAESCGFIVKDVRQDISDLYRISLTDEGRKQFNLPRVKTLSAMARIREAMKAFGLWLPAK